MFLELFKNTIQLILAPSSGWEDVSVSRIDTDVLNKRYMFPMMMLAGLTLFVQMIYHSEMTFIGTFLHAVVIFTSLFITYFFSMLTFDYFFYHFCDQEPSTHKMTTVISYVMILLSLSTILCNLLPVNLGLRFLLPLGVTLIMWKANIYLKVNEDKDFFYILFGVVTTILPPTIIQHLFNNLLPQ